MRLFCLPFLFLAMFPSSLFAQQMPAEKARVDENALAILPGTLHPLARQEFDRGAVADDFPLRRLLLRMARPAGREKALQQFLADVHTSGSPVYHHWVRPEEFGERFGASDDDTQLVTEWLQAHGLAVARVAKNRSMIEFSGTAGQLREALHTEIHQYSVQGKTYFANANEISVPAAIAARIGGFAPINSFPFDSYVKTLGSGVMNRANHRVTPQFTLTENNAPFYAFGPEDFAIQYDVAPVYAAGINGAGQTIGIIGANNLNLALVSAYRKLFNLPADHTQVIVDGQDPGDGNGPNVEGYLDVEMSGAVAPEATVNFYIAGAEAISTPASNSLTLAALRAVEDNQAAVLSVSYGECELNNGESGNQFWANLWEQAAAQGQTVFVSSGDSGPTTCQPTEGSMSNMQFLPSVNVNGLSSTPWNVSVGGTDFYYADFANGAPSAATMWNQTNDASEGSLKAALPEQVWDDPLGFNAISNPLSGGSGGGGVSNCAQETTPTDGSLPNCLSGYPKPAWQNAPGVPKDQARDLPDLSLFAANGANLSATPLCAEPGDCAPVSTGQPQITLVGGTSVSSPAMAGVMALINQKYGRQGQANYTFYALARQVPSVFHDITLGSNDITCLGGSGFGPPDCDVPVPNIPYVDSYGIYAASSGYDLASGLGSVDVNQLLTNWNKVAYAPTTTMLSASPASIVHGAAVAINIAVKANSGSAVPTGDVVLTASAGTAIPENLPVTLANGAATASLTNLSGGSYQLMAEYGGDGSFDSSISTPASLTVTPEASTTSLTYVARGAPIPTLPQGQVAYGANISFSAKPTSQATKAYGQATGTVTFTDGGTSATVALDGNGVATWRPQSFAVGTHTVSAAYLGDASYLPSSSSPAALTVVKNVPEFLVIADTNYAGCAQGLNGCGSDSGSVYQPGTDMVFSIALFGGNGVPPTGTVTVNFGSLTQTVTLAPVSNIASAWATFSKVPAGSYALSASYSGDANWDAASNSNAIPFVFAAPEYAPPASTTTLTLSPSTVDSSGSVTFNVTTLPASSQNGCFIGNGIAVLYANGVSFGFVNMGCVMVNGVATISGNATVPASELPPGSYQVVAELGGGPVLSSFSSAVPLTVTVTDFSMSLLGRNVSVAAGQSVTVPVSLGGPSSAGITVALSCATSSPSIVCAINPSTANVTGSGTASLTVNAFTLTTQASVAATMSSSSDWLFRTPSAGWALALLMIFPGKRRKLNLFGLLVLGAAFASSAGCGSNSSFVSTPPPVQKTTPAPSGSYSVTVAGVSAGITHRTTVNIQVQ
jgi:hypothetical protein